MAFDLPFLLATGAFGWGLSLATYRLFAMRNRWPMGSWQAFAPGLPVAIGLVCVLIAFLFAAARGSEVGGWSILILGLLLALLWTGFLRVASQISLLLAPVTAMLLVALWVGETLTSQVQAGGEIYGPQVPSSTVLTLPELYDSRTAAGGQTTSSGADRAR